MSGWSKTFILLSGILYAFVGVYCFFQPIGALIGLAWSFGFLVLTSGIFGVIAYIQIPKEERVIWGLLVCLTDIIFGMLVLTFNGTMILSALLPLFFAVTFIIRGIFTLIHSRDFDALITHKVLFRILCIMQILLGTALLAFPQAAALTMVYFFGIGCLFAGFAKISLWNDLRSL